MTLEEKKKAIQEICGYSCCVECPLGNVPGSCWDDEDLIERNYEIMFGPTPAVNTCVSCGAEIPEGRLVCPNCDEQTCETCAFENTAINEEPCSNCRNSMPFSDPRYESTPLKWKPIGYIEPDPANIGDDLDNPPDEIENKGLIERLKELSKIEEDPVKPDYYNDTCITPFNVIDDWGLNFYLGNAVKYIKRAGKKAGNSRLQDLKKIREYIDHEIRAEEGER